MSEWTVVRGSWSCDDEGKIESAPNGPILHLVFDGKSPANTLSLPCLEELGRTLDEVEEFSGIEALILSSAKDEHFIAGANIEAIEAITDSGDATSLAQIAQRVFGKLGELPFPSFALIHGTCLGGGLELALGCNFRIAVDAANTKIGLPEVNLGIIPGFGGSQRLPRLIGVAKALPLILGGTRLPAQVARKRGIVDAVIPPEGYLTVSLNVVQQIVKTGGKKILSARKKKRGGIKSWALTKNIIGRWFLRRAARKQVLTKTGGHYPAPLAAIDLVVGSASRSLQSGLREEARVVGELAVSPVCKNLIALFQSSERARKKTGPENSEHGEWPERGFLGILGAGVMGAGVASTALQRGFSVRIRDLGSVPLARGLGQIAKDVNNLVHRRRRTRLEADEILSRLTHTSSLVGFGRCDGVLEAIVERLDVKQRALQEVEPYLMRDALFLTNTSALSVNEIATAAKYPDRVVGLHFFNPVQKMPLVEVVAGEETADWAISRTIGLAQALGKYPVVVKDSPGFLVNRLLMPYLDAAVRLLQLGVPGPQIDRAALKFGLPMGPLRLIDEVGVDIGVEVAGTLYKAFGERAKPSDLLQQFADRGWLGCKSGRGFYVYSGHPKRRKEYRDWNGEVEVLLDGKSSFQPTSDELISALLDPMVDEAARCLEEDVVENAEAVDLAMVMGTGFPPFRGGLLRYADETGLAVIVERIKQGQSNREPSTLLSELAMRGATFHGSQSEYPVNKVIG